MKRIQHPKAACAWCTPHLSVVCLVLCFAACISEGATEELGTVKYTPGLPLPESAVPRDMTVPLDQNPTPDAIDQPALSDPSLKPADGPIQDPAGPSAGPADPAQPNVDMDPGPGPVAMTPDTPNNEPVAGGAAPPTDVMDPDPIDPPETTPEPAGPGMLTVAFTSKSVGGRYSPRNVGAVWIEDERGGFVKTIERWAAIRAADLRTWNGASGGWGFSFFGVSSGGSADQMDAVTAATLRNHTMHMATWNMKDVDGQVVPDGSYRVVVEVADGRAAVDRIEFQKGPMAQTMQGEGSVFSNMTVTYSR